MPINEIEYILKSFRRDVIELEKMASGIVIERHVLLRERDLSPEARQEIEEYTARLKQSLEELFVKIRP